LRADGAEYGTPAQRSPGLVSPKGNEPRGGVVDSRCVSSDLLLPRAVAWVGGRPSGPKPERFAVSTAIARNHLRGLASALPRWCRRATRAPRGFGGGSAKLVTWTQCHAPPSSEGGAWSGGFGFRAGWSAPATESSGDRDLDRSAVSDRTSVEDLRGLGSARHAATPRTPVGRLPRASRRSRTSRRDSDD
jgi:hypothetical protein